ncbi:MAG: hypothetical protein ACOYKB_05380 [Succiniclasticum sp.]
MSDLSTLPLYVDLTCTDVPSEQSSVLTVTVPEGFVLLPKQGWRLSADRRQAVTAWQLPAAYGRSFDLLYIHALEGTVSGEKKIQVRLALTGPEKGEEDRTVTFFYDAAYTMEDGDPRPAVGNKADSKKFNWYIQSVTLPVDNQGRRDDRARENVLYIRDAVWENFRNRMTGDKNNGYAVIFSHPTTFFLLDMRNPQRDIRMLKCRVRLYDKNGKAVPGLMTAGRSDHESGGGWAGETGTKEETTALLSLDGQKSQTFILPLYIDPLQALEGEYRLRFIVEGNGQEKVTEVPVLMDKKHSLGLFAVAFSFACVLVTLLYLRSTVRCIRTIGARGAITVSLFAAVSFGGITLPTTILGDVVHAFLGPFSTFVTGILSGVLQYLLIMALLMLYRKPGVLPLMFLVKFFLNGIFFGRFTPLSILSVSVYIAILETLSRASGFYRTERPGKAYVLFVVILLGIGDALIGFINLEQMMFFYRLYYADWYIILYMLVNGVFYSSIGAWIGYRTGQKLQQIAGE